MTYTVTFSEKNVVHSFSPQPLETSPAMTPSQTAVGEEWIPFCLESLTAEKAIRRSLKPYEIPHTVELEIIGHVHASIGGLLISDQIEDGGEFGVIDSRDLAGEVNEFLANLSRREVRRRTIKEITLVLQKLRGKLSNDIP